MDEFLRSTKNPELDLVTKASYHMLEDGYEKLDGLCGIMCTDMYEEDIEKIAALLLEQYGETVYIFKGRYIGSVDDGDLFIPTEYIAL